MKVAVLADDLTGAAELGGIGGRFGLETTISFEVDLSSRSGMTVIDTDTRTLSADDARSITGRAAGQLAVGPERRLYKKVDSVLRGPVLAEIESILGMLGKQRAFLAPANPSKGRLIRDGIYYSEGRPIHQTSFARDPTNPIRSSEVLTMLGQPQSYPVFLRRPDEPLPLHGIIVCEASSCSDLEAWVKRLDETTLAAGGVEFFESSLRALLGTRSAISDEPLFHGSSSLIINGSAFHGSLARIPFFQTSGIPVVPMPAGLVHLRGRSERSTLVQQWADLTLEALHRSSRVVVAVGQPLISDPSAPSQLRNDMAELVTAVMQRGSVDHLYIEGGSTATAIVRRLGWSRLTVIGEWAPGITCMQPEGPDRPRLTLKPGSYPWPKQLFEDINKPSAANK